MACLTIVPEICTQAMNNACSRKGEHRARSLEIEDASGPGEFGGRWNELHWWCEPFVPDDILWDAR